MIPKENVPRKEKDNMAGFILLLFIFFAVIGLIITFLAFIKFMVWLWV